ncbi:MAG: hypothetical protein ACRC6X_08875 [Culicoidibacterales bacterium]
MNQDLFIGIIAIALIATGIIYKVVVRNINGTNPQKEKINEESVEDGIK